MKLELVWGLQDIVCNVEDFYYLNCSGKTLNVFMPVNNIRAFAFLKDSFRCSHMVFCMHSRHKSGSGEITYKAISVVQARDGDSLNFSY